MWAVALTGPRSQSCQDQIANSGASVCEQTQALLLAIFSTDCVNVGKLFNLSELQLSHL